jgi:hypothetical protein
MLGPLQKNTTHDEYIIYMVQVLTFITATKNQPNS